MNEPRAASEQPSPGDTPSLERWQQALSALREGRLVAVATESWFALAGNALDVRALDVLFAMKGRSQAHAVALMAPDQQRWRSLVTRVPALAQHWADSFWPGPLTLVLDAAKQLDPRIVHDGTVGVRIPGASLAQRLVHDFDGVLTATSANLAGEPPCRTAAEVRRVFGAWVQRGELQIIDGDAPGGAPSTLVHVGAHGFSVLRHGAIAASSLEASAIAAGLTTQSAPDTA